MSKQHCGVELPDEANFCPICRKKLSNVCYCWRLKRPYDCGESECPGFYMDENGNFPKNWRELEIDSKHKAICSVYSSRKRKRFLLRLKSKFHELISWLRRKHV